MMHRHNVSTPNTTRSFFLLASCRLHPYATWLLNLDAKAVDQLGDLETAFGMLLSYFKSPQVAEDGGGDEILILIDALDEADPPEQQELSGGEGGPAACVRACGNQTLLLLTTLFALELPHCVRYILTSRPDAACGGIRDILVRVFPDVAFLIPEDLHNNGLQHLVQSVVVAGKHANPLLTTVVRECSLDLAGDGSIDVDGDGALQRGGCNDEGRDSGGGDGDAALQQQRGGSDGVEPVYVAFRAVFSRSESQRGRGTSEATFELMDVLLAAQEPLSHSMLQRMGLLPHLKELPGWQTLFFTADHHVYTIHKVY